MGGQIGPDISCLMILDMTAVHRTLVGGSDFVKLVDAHCFWTSFCAEFENHTYFCWKSKLARF